MMGALDPHQRILPLGVGGGLRPTDWERGTE